MIQAIVGMWRKVGIDANIEVYEIAKHFELRMPPQARAGRVLQLGQRDRRSDHLDRLRDVRSQSPHSAWHSDDLDAKIGPLWGEKDEEKRIAGWKAVDTLHRRAGLRAAAAAIRPADPLQVRPQGHPERLRRVCSRRRWSRRPKSASKRSAAAPGRAAAIDAVSRKDR